MKIVLTYAITDITTWGADMPLKVGHVRTRAYLYIFKLICLSWWELYFIYWDYESTIMAHYDRQV